MRNKIYISFILMFSFTFLTGDLFACNSTNEKIEVEKTNFQNHCRKNCICHSKQSENDQGNCGDKTCHCSPHCGNLVLLFSESAKIGNNVLIQKKSEFISQQYHLSNGFYSIWTPPNIG